MGQKRSKDSESQRCAAQRRVPVDTRRGNFLSHIYAVWPHLALRDIHTPVCPDGLAGTQSLRLRPARNRSLVNVRAYSLHLQKSRIACARVARECGVTNSTCEVLSSRDDVVPTLISEVSDSGSQVVSMVRDSPTLCAEKFVVWRRRL